jgi:hypothetical protein
MTGSLVLMRHTGGGHVVGSREPTEESRMKRVELTRPENPQLRNVHFTLPELKSPLLRKIQTSSTEASLKKPSRPSLCFLSLYICMCVCVYVCV